MKVFLFLVGAIVLVGAPLTLWAMNKPVPQPKRRPKPVVAVQSQSDLASLKAINHGLIQLRAQALTDAASKACDGQGALFSPCVSGALSKWEVNYGGSLQASLSASNSEEANKALFNIAAIRMAKTNLEIQGTETQLIPSDEKPLSQTASE